jgi:mono/diheme cytochrome c family protein
VRIGRKFFVAGLAAATVAAALAAAPEEDEAKARAGAELYKKLDCAHCHGTALEGTAKGPSLASLPKDWTTERITAQILNGGQKMPPFGEALSDDEIAQLVAFLRSRK